MSLLKNASTNRRKRRESLDIKRILPPDLLLSITPSNPLIDPVQEPLYALGYKSNQSKVIHLKRDDLLVGVKGIRALWGYLYGVTSTNTPIAISSLFEYVNGQSRRAEVKGWTVNSNVDTTHYKALVVHRPRCIKLATNNVDKLFELMNEIHPNDSHIWRISYKDLSL